MTLIDNSPAGFLDALVARINEVLSSSWWESAEFTDDEFHTPVVHAQYLPVSLTASADRNPAKDFPLVQVYCAGGRLESFSNAVLPNKLDVKIICGGYRNDPDNQGWRISANILWRIVQAFMERRQIAGYQLITPFSWSIPQDETKPFWAQPPYWSAILETTWEGAAPSQLLLGGKRPAGPDEIVNVVLK